MAIHQGKAGTRRITGIQKAQLLKAASLIDHLIVYNDKMAAKVPPVFFMSPADQTAIAQASVVMRRVAATVNVGP